METNIQSRDCIEKSNCRDVQMAINLQERSNNSDEDILAIHLTQKYGWNLHHAREIAELAWVEMYAEKEGA